MKPNAESALPLYAQLEEILSQRINAGELNPGDQLPAEDQLVSEFEVSRTTVRTTIQNLARRGMVEIRRGKGTFVAQPKIATSLAGLTGFVEDMHALGRRPTARLLGYQIVPADETVATKLKVDVGTSVMYIRRVRLANDIALCYDETYLPRDLGEKVIADNLETEPIFTLLELKYQTPLSEAEYRLEAISADSKVAEVLNIEVGSPIFFIERNSYSAEGRPVDYEKLYYRGDHIQFVTRLIRPACVGGPAGIA
ncbi:GntR family transcriptional regulator [Paraburkholderia gardini]|uniref:HTH-type transcriptional repressor NagR n=1 Tax=Paraburkholderia gardini TaxID=2823469 RepID=A0ABM8U7K7_9BURK|nr:GntR family transcriptional regulator [Paraburkholderia gardini]CAG4902597.1 HTH-type transcriptional repressor NagR [Paraburkholderia gardini]CAG4910585.1 HTH-type transcriptional repressor NagR [Paraburkholderia gardini]